MRRLIGFCASISIGLVACTQMPIAKPPVVDASWKATEDNRIARTISDLKTSIPVFSKPDESREKDETNMAIPVEPVARIEPIDKPKRSKGMSTALLSLFQQADELRNAGDLEAASSRLERAQRIAPTEPEVYFQLSSLRLAESKLEDAVSIATQGIDLAGSDRAMKRDLYNLIARAKDALGDSSGATIARQLARQFGS